MPGDLEEEIERLARAIQEAHARGDDETACKLFNERGKLIARRPLRPLPENFREICKELDLANANTRFVHARDRIGDLEKRADGATLAAKTRALGETLIAVANALDDITPELAPQRGRLEEYVKAAVPTAIARIVKRRDGLEVEHVVDLLREAHERHVDGEDGWCTVEECHVEAVKWLASRGYERAAEHLRKERAIYDAVVSATSRKAFNAALLRLLRSNGFASVTTVASLRVMLRDARKARPGEKRKC